ncbi:hypothetical protein LVD17_26075 [Fulvivirga ulvae]|uniref:hypothetical protein n=1 Tax=Fulvivirga ulvae TaxID=2904245 RepID=UPI001F25613C|nr:hypothetical protein [Fulvivirga ulvae]UII31760.1 hypothetical protein LVD17_26075 [Fulvivirga ulvae]
MTNFVLTYKIEDKDEASDFIDFLRSEYPYNKLEIRHNIRYFAFTASDLTSVEEDVSTTIKEYNTSISDYVALYYVKDESSPKIKKLMIYGSADRAEQDLKAISSTEHESLLNDMLDIDFMAIKVDKQYK